MPRLFVFGLGYTGLALAGQMKSLGWNVAGTAQRPGKIRDLHTLGIEAYTFNREHPLPAPAAALSDAAYVLNTIPPDDGGDPVYDLHGGDLVTLGPQLRWFGYLSTTGVYGNHEGKWVTEDTPPQPASQRAKARLKAERDWLELADKCGLATHIFRLSGIYGPGRNALAEMRAGTARRIDKEGQVFNRIHVEDIVRALIASMHHPRAGRVYNLADDEPAPSHEVVAHAARLLGLEPPPLVPFADARLSPMAASFYADNKRVDNTRLKQELGLRLAYPTYREGLVQIAKSLPPDEAVYE